jgi:hypothetical protein
LYRYALPWPQVDPVELAFGQQRLVAQAFDLLGLRVVERRV